MVLYYNRRSTQIQEIYISTWNQITAQQSQQTAPIIQIPSFFLLPEENNDLEFWMITFFSKKPQFNNKSF